MLNLVHLKVLAAVARHGSVTEAARELHYSQPTMSHHRPAWKRPPAAALTEAHPGLALSVIDRHPVEALQMLRQGEVDVALVFRYAHAPLEDDGFRMAHVADDPIYLVSRRPDDSIANHRHSAWIGGCERCQGELTAVCRQHVTYGDPPDPPATTALIHALLDAAR
jgi:DNA-binding transcriptional LysR family regulator